MVCHTGCCSSSTVGRIASERGMNSSGVSLTSESDRRERTYDQATSIGEVVGEGPTVRKKWWRERRCAGEERRELGEGGGRREALAGVERSVSRSRTSTQTITSIPLIVLSSDWLSWSLRNRSFSCLCPYFERWETTRIPSVVAGSDWDDEAE